MIWIPPGRAPKFPSAYDASAVTVPDGLPVVRWFGEDVPEVLADVIEDGWTFAAHNALGFDAIAWRRFAPPWQQPEWYDTLPCARAAGLPGKLDEIGERLTGAGKDEAGKKVMLLLSAAKSKAGAVSYTVGTAAAWNLLLRYNVQDVSLLERVFHETIDYGEPDVLAADRAINSRGVRVDRGLAEAIQRTWNHAEYEAESAIVRLTEGAISNENIRSPEQVKKWVESKGVRLESLDKSQIGRFLEAPQDHLGDDSDVPDDALALIVEVLTLRQTVVSASAAKIKALLNKADGRDSRVRNALVYHGAGPGRWTSYGVQLHNMARGHKDVDVAACLDLYDTDRFWPDELQAASPGAPLRDILSTLIRPVFRADPDNLLAIADFAGIEARGLSWLAGDEEMLGVFRSGGDPYKTMASAIFGVPVAEVTKDQRQIGKVVVLGCGYGMGRVKFGAYCKSIGLDLVAAGTSAEACITAYRTARAPVKSLWNAYDRAVMDVVTGKKVRVHVGRCDFFMRGEHLITRLPSGREIVYRSARVENLVPPYCKMLGLPEIPKPAVVYTHPRGYAKSLYGGLITENVCQGTCRDVMAIAIVRCEAEGLPVVMHVHDEVVVEVHGCVVDEALERLCEIMAEPPAWAGGFPIGVEGFTSPRYVKSALPGYTQIKR